MNNAYSLLATILRYPGADYYPAVLSMQTLSPEILSAFADWVATSTENELDDLYVKTFDIHAICFLEVGYVLFGEDYKRGHLLVKLQELHHEFGVDCGVELADHLPNLLHLLPLLKAARPEESQALVEKIVLPALDKMLEGFAEKGNVFAGPLKAVKEILERDYDCKGMSPHAPADNLIHLPAYKNESERWPS